MSKKYRIIQSFFYRGKDGKSKNAIRLGPGEECPELDPNERVRLLKEERICEVSAEGENIRYKKLLDLSEEQIDNLLAKPRPFIMNEIKNVMYSKDTLSKMYAKADTLKLGAPLLELIEQRIAGEL